MSKTETGLHIWTWEELQERIPFEAPQAWITPPDIPEHLETKEAYAQWCKEQGLIPGEGFTKMLQGLAWGAILEALEFATVAGERFTIAPAHIIEHKEVNAAELAVWLVVRNRAWGATGKAYCQRSNTWIGEKVDIKSRDTVAKHLDALEEKNFVRIERNQYWEDGKPAPNKVYPTTRAWNDRVMTPEDWKKELYD